MRRACVNAMASSDLWTSTALTMGLRRQGTTVWAKDAEASRKVELKPVEMVATYGGVHPSSGTPSSAVEGAAAPDEPLSVGLRTTLLDASPYRVAWFAVNNLSPSKVFVYWAYHRLRELPPEWREYYRRMLRQEVKAARFVGQRWDVFMMVVDGFRKGKWILQKFDIPIDESKIPKPYGNFWEDTTHEERVWAHRRSHQMKDLQAVQREDIHEMVFGAQTLDRNEVCYNNLGNVTSRLQGGTPVHAADLPAPSEEDIKMTRAAEDMASAFMSGVEDDKMWNPVLKARLYKQKTRENNDEMGFEDEETDGCNVTDDAEVGRKAVNVPPPKFAAHHRFEDDTGER